MQVQQIYSIVNDIAQETVGDTAVVNEDLSNIVDIGTQILGATSVDNYVRSLIDKIGKTVFVNRVYNGNVPSVLRDGWEYGSILEKIDCELPIATENDTWQLTDGQSYNQDIFTKPTVSAKFYNSKVTFEIPLSIAERQVKESFHSVTALNAFFSMIYNSVDKAMTIRISQLVMRTINTLTAETLYDAFNGGAISGGSTSRAVNLLYLYNHTFSPATPLTADKALTTPEFLRFASYTISLIRARMKEASELYNMGGKTRFTPTDLQHVVMLADFSKASQIYLESDTYWKELVALKSEGTMDEVAFWQGSGTDFGFSSVSKIDVKTPDNHTVSATGILAVLFDHDACAVTNEDRRVTTHYNAKAEFTNSWFKYDCSYLVDYNENFIVFYVA